VSVRRLTDADKRQIVDLYRTPGETAATLADQFGVSNTTIGRILKAGISVKEYDKLVQQKRRGNDSAASIASIPSDRLEESPADVSIPVSDLDEAIEASVQSSPIAVLQSDNNPTPEQRRSRRRSSAPISVPTPSSRSSAQSNAQSSQQLEVFPSDDDLDQSDYAPAEFLPDKPKKVIQIGVRSDDSSAKRSNDKPVRRSEAVFDQDEGEEELLLPVTEEIAAIMEEDFGDDEIDEVDDLEEDEEDEDEDEEDEIADPDQDLLSLQTENLIRVRPFEEADMPRTCYLVIDRAAELVVRPLGDFGDLGPLPEAQTMTLPIFDNHRVAKRFATDRTQRVIKVPDSQVFYKTAFQLRSKGITHLFVDGQIYSL
jgi:transposase-like protein